MRRSNGSRITAAVQPGLGDLAEVFLGMDVERTAERQRRAHRIGAAAALVPRGARNDVVSGEPVGEMRIAVDRQQGAVGIAGDQDGARTHEIGNDRRHARAHRVVERRVAPLEAVDVRTVDPQWRRFGRRIDAVLPAAAPRLDDDIAHGIVVDRAVGDEPFPGPADGPDVVLGAQLSERDIFHHQAPPKGCRRSRRTASALRDEMLDAGIDGRGGSLLAERIGARLRPCKSSAL